MAAAKKTAAKQPAAKKREQLTKVWKSGDGDLALTLIADPGDFELTVENTGADEFIQLAVSTEQIDELIAMLTTAKETVSRYERGEQIASDPLPVDDDEEEEEELDEDEEDDLDDEDGEEDLDDEEEDLDDEEEEDADE